MTDEVLLASDWHVAERVCIPPATDRRHEVIAERRDLDIPELRPPVDRRDEARIGRRFGDRPLWALMAPLVDEDTPLVEL